MTKKGFLADSAIAFVLAVATGCGTATAALKSDGDRRAACVANAGDATALASGHAIPFFPSASDARGRQGFARLLNHSAEAGEVTIAAFDDDGACYGPLTLTLGANETAHFNSDDLENGNAAKGLGSGTGWGQGDWRLELASELEVEVLSYIRTSDGFVTSMHDTVAWGDGGLRVPIFNPGSNGDQESLLRLVNLGEAAATVTITGTDDSGNSGAGRVTVEVPARAARTYTAAELESGSAAGLDGSLGDGADKWRLAVRSDQAIVAMSLLSSPTGHLTNLSTVPGNGNGGVHGVPLLPSASDPLGRQGFVRVINHSDESGDVSITAFDDTGRAYEGLALSLGANETKHFNSNDLETGNPQKGLSGRTGAGDGDWRLELSGDLAFEVLAYIRTPDGFLTAAHDTVPGEDNAYRIFTFNPGRNVDQSSRVRLVNTGGQTAQVTITGIDDDGVNSSEEVSVAVPAGASRTLTAQELETGGGGFGRGIGQGAGKWRLVVESAQPVTLLNLLSSRTGHLANLSGGPAGALTSTFDFHRGPHAFVAGFADYPPADEEHYGLTSDYRPLPSALGSRSALFISGVNHSDDLFMFLKGEIGGVVPGARYAATVSVEIATDTRTGCFGVGGSPGESVSVNAGVSEVEPVPVLSRAPTFA